MVVWKPDWYEVRIINEIAHTISCQVKYIPMKITFMVTFVYAHNLRNERRSLWEHIHQLHMDCQLPWIIMGDFNAVPQQENKIGGNQVALSEVVDF